MIEHIPGDSLAWHTVAITCLAIGLAISGSRISRLRAQITELEQKLSEVPRRFVAEDKPLRRRPPNMQQLPHPGERVWTVDDPAEGPR